jgi:hypothetical protein
MTDTFRFITNSEEFVARVQAAEPKLGKVARRGLVELVETWTTRMKTGRFTGYYPGRTRGRKLRVRSGALRSSVGGRVLGKKLDDLRAIFRVGGGRAGYARIQELGGTVHPKRARMLTIPIGAPRGSALTAAGNIRAKAKPRFAGTTKSGAPIYETGYGRTHLFRSKAGNLVITAGSGKNTVLLYVLKNRAKIPPRLRAFETLVHATNQKVPDLHRDIFRVLALDGKAG